VDLVKTVETLQTEIAERKRIQRELEEIKRRFRSLVEQVKDYAIIPRMSREILPVGTLVPSELWISYGRNYRKAFLRFLHKGRY